MLALGLAMIFAMAYAEGANDVSKVVGTLVGSGVATCRRAILFGAVCTAIGAASAVVLTPAVVATLTTGLLEPGAAVHPAFALSAIVGASGWVLLATRAAVPVSSSHAIIGAILVLGAVVFGVERVRWDAVGTRVVLPLAVSPFVAMPLAVILAAIARRCPAGPLETAHWCSAGLASFARGASDAPKIVALGAFFHLVRDGGVTPLPLPLLFVCVAFGMTAGSFVAGWRVTETLARRVARIDAAGGCAANAATSLVLLTASRLGLPTSTTHVVTASIIATALERDSRAVQWRTVGRLAVAWLVTLPVSGLLASLSYWLMRDRL